MGVRVATLEDLDLVLKLAEKFTEEAGYAQFVHPDKAKELTTQFLMSDPTERVILLYDDIGIIAGSKNQFAYGYVFLATELLWWVDPEHRNGMVGKTLMEAFEFWAKKAGCIGVVMSSLDDSVGKYYEKVGYRLYERAYFKEI